MIENHNRTKYICIECKTTSTPYLNKSDDFSLFHVIFDWILMKLITCFISKIFILSEMNDTEKKLFRHILHLKRIISHLFISSIQYFHLVYGIYT